jgi:hypothetical protein
MSAPVRATPTLFEEISRIIPEELGIRRNILSALFLLGINPEKNSAEYKSGHNCTAFLLPEKNIVIKFFGNECEESNVKFPNESRYLLQPFCHTDVVGNQLAIFPLLQTSGVTDAHADELYSALAAEGYLFSDRKLKNIGLTAGGIPYVIDNDAATKIEDLKPTESRRDIQWSYIDPRFSLDHAPTIKSLRWEFDSTVKQKMFGHETVPDGASRLSDAERLVELERKKESESSAKL